MDTAIDPTRVAETPGIVVQSVVPASTETAIRVGDVRSKWILPVLLGISGIVFAGVLYLTSYTNFFYDEWDFVSQDRPWRPDLLWVSHNEHWSTIPILVYKLLFLVIGLRSHLPYEAALLIAHVGAVLLLFTLIRRRSGDLPAFAAALILLVFGSGGTDIVWAFQIGFVGSVAFGLLAMVLLDGKPPFPSRLVPVSLALTASLMCSGAGLAFLIAIAVELLLDPTRRRFLLALIPPAIAFGEWFLAFGAGLPGSPGAPCPTCRAEGFSADIASGNLGTTYLLTLASFIWAGVSASAGGVLGLPDLGGACLILVLGVIWMRWPQMADHRVRLIATATGLGAWFLLTGLGRAQHGPNTAEESRYLYIGAVFLLPVFAEAARELPWSRIWQPVLVVALLISVSSNVLQLRDRALFDFIPSLSLPQSQARSMFIENAELRTVEVFRGAPDMALDRSPDDRLMPQLTAGNYLAAVSELGSPVPPASLGMLNQLPTDAVDRVLINLFGGAISVTEDNSRSTGGFVCRDIDSRSGAVMDFVVPGGQSLMMLPSVGGDGVLSLSYLGPPPPQPLQHFQMRAGTKEWIYLPNTGKTIDWHVRISTTAGGTTRVCAAQGELNPVPAPYFGSPSSGSLGTGWVAVADRQAAHGYATRARGGTFTTWQSDVFGIPIVPVTRSYDVWYRVRVSSLAGTEPEMLLALWDDEDATMVGSAMLRASQATLGYTWIKIAAAVVPKPGHHVQFIAAFMSKLSTDWFFDRAVMVPAGAGPLPS